MEDLQEAIAHFYHSLALRPPSHPDRSQSLGNLANAIKSRFQQLGNMEDLQQAITYHRQAVDLCPPGHLNYSIFLNNLANAVWIRFEQAGRMEDLEEGIMYHQQALELRPSGDPNRSSSLNNLAGALRTRFQQLGHREDLERAITYHRQSLDLRPPGHPLRSSSLNNLASSVGTRFQQLGNIGDMEEAIRYHQEALNLRPPGHPERSTSFNNLASAVGTRFRQLGKMEDLEEAIACHHQALELYPPGHPDRSKALNNYAGTIMTRFEQLGEMGDLEQVIAYRQQALDLRPPGHPDRPTSLLHLAISLNARFHRLSKMADLEESIKLYSEAEESLLPHHPDHSTTRSHLASGILEWCCYSPKSDHATQMISNAFALFESAAYHSTSRASDRFFAALDWVRGARRCQHSSILRAYSTALICLDRRVTMTPTVQSWQKYLSFPVVPRSLASDAASSAIEEGILEVAVELLEQGRSILWSRMQGFRHSLDKLRELDRDLADEFDYVSQCLEHHAMSSEVTPGFYDQQVKRHRVLSEKWDEVVQRIRQQDGFANFLQAVPFASLRLAASEGPVIIVNISQHRSDALILQQHDPPVLVRLPNALPNALHQLSRDLSTALALNHNRTRAIYPILQQLWHVIVSPIVNQLVMLGVVEGSRIWWCPTSYLCALPLHAAGPYQPHQKNLPDIYTSSYTPTLSSLIKARSHVIPRLTAPKLLAMGQPNDHLEQSKLPEVREELRRIQRFGSFIDVLLGEQANRETLLDYLQQYPWIHFACHGHLTPNEPFLSSFQLHSDERITLADLMKARLPNAELAFLSACNSAAIDVDNTPDEVIHLAAALQFCGFRSVVGTLWSMADIDGPDVAEDFYKYMFQEVGGTGDFRDSSMALNHATRQMRKKGVPVDRWINFIHIGA